MPAINYVVAIEIGSTYITGIAGQKHPDGSLHVQALVKKDASQCIRKGVVSNIDKTAQCVREIIEALSKQLKAKILFVYVGVGGQSVYSQPNIIVREMGREPADVKSMHIDEMKDQNCSMEYSDMVILDFVQLEYRADVLTVTDPVGVQCSRLEGNFLNILQNKRHKQRLQQCFDKAGVIIQDLYIAPMALADVVLLQKEKVSGCVLVDMGADTTTVMVYHKNILRHIAVIPLGGNNITKDIASVFSLEESVAEELKCRYASAYTPVGEIDPTEVYKVDSERSINAEEFIEVVEARVYEIIMNVWNQVPETLRSKMKVNGFIITGGAANLCDLNRAFTEYTKIDKVTHIKSIYSKVSCSDNKTILDDGTLNTALGLLARGGDNCCRALEARVGNMFEEQPEQPQGGEESVAPQTPQQPAAEGAAVQTQTPVQPVVQPDAPVVTPEPVQSAQVTPQPAAPAEPEKPATGKGEPDKKKKKGGIGTRFVKWLTSMTEADPED